MRPDISVLIPARNEGARTGATIRALARARSTDARLEFVVVDDASTDNSVDALVRAVPTLLKERAIDVRLDPLPSRAGIYGARNTAAAHARADILFITDAHVEAARGWDRQVLEHVRPGRVLAGVVAEKGGPFRGYGCTLAVPLMGTHWLTTPIGGVATVPIAPATATALPRETFERIGGYDAGMALYGAGVPEFSVRAWLLSGEVKLAGGLEVTHAFKPLNAMLDMIAEVRPFWVHNCLRFATLYLSDAGRCQVLAHFAETFPEVMPEALAMLEQSDVWQRRSALQSAQQRSFAWFVRSFGIRTATGEILM